MVACGEERPYPGRGISTEVHPDQNVGLLIRVPIRTRAKDYGSYSVN